MEMKMFWMQIQVWVAVYTGLILSDVWRETFSKGIKANRGEIVPQDMTDAEQKAWGMSNMLLVTVALH